MKEIAKKTFWISYDHLGGLILLNLVWSALSLPWILIGYGLVVQGAKLPGWGLFMATFLALELVFLSPPTLLLFAAGTRWARGEAVHFKTLFKEMRKFAVRGQLLGLILFFMSLQLLLNVYFYRQFGGWTGLILGSTMVWFLIAALLMSPYLFPLLILQDGGVWHTLRHSFLLMIDNVKLSIVLFLTILFVVFVGAVSVVGLFCGVLGVLTLLLCICFRELLPKYTGEPLAEEPARKWRELIRPWEV